MPPTQRSAQFTFRFDPGTVPSMRARLYPAFHRNLAITLSAVCGKIIAESDKLLVELPPNHVPWNGDPGGRDTSLMANSLAAVLMAATEDGVFYELKSTEAYYWQWIEFGHFVHTADGPRWWEGYHFFERAIIDHTKDIIAAAKLAWHLAIVEAGGGGRQGLTAGAIAALSAGGGL